MYANYIKYLNTKSTYRNSQNGAGKIVCVGRTITMHATDPGSIPGLPIWLDKHTRSDPWQNQE